MSPDASANLSLIPNQILILIVIQLQILQQPTNSPQNPLMLSILQGDHVNHPSVEYIQTKKLHIENLSGEEVKVDYDGEELPEGFPVDISIIPQAINIVVPK